VSSFRGPTIRTLSRARDTASSTTILSASEEHGIHDYVWTSDGRIIYGVDAGASYAPKCNYWEIRVNSRTGKPISMPNRVTNWAGFVSDWTSVSADSRRLAFVQSVNGSTINLLHVGASGIRRDSARKLTLFASSGVCSEFCGAPTQWRHDIARPIGAKPHRIAELSALRSGAWPERLQGIATFTALHHGWRQLVLLRLRGIQSSRGPGHTRRSQFCRVPSQFGRLKEVGGLT